MAVLHAPPLKYRFYDVDGVTPLAGGRVFTYATGTTTPQATYSNLAGTSANSNPIVLDANGEAVIYLTAGVVYDFVSKRPAPDDTVVQTRAGITQDSDASLRTDLATATTGNGAALLGWPSGYGINQSRTNQHFTQNGAAIHRLGDRILLCAAADNDGAFPNVIQDWQSQEWVAGGFGAGPMASAIFGVASSTNPNSAIGVNSAVRSKHCTSAGTTPIGVFGCAFNDNTTLGSKVYGGYYEAHRTATSTGVDTIGLEIDTRTMTDSIAPDPYTFGEVVALQLASGAEWSATGQFDASCAIQIAGNPVKFKKGIVFRNDALTDLGGGLKEAIALPNGSMIRQWSAAGSPASYIYFATGTAAGSSSVQLADGNFKVTETSTGSEQFRVTVTTNAVNFCGTIAGASGTSPGLEARGSGANLDLRLLGKGTGGPQLIDGAGATKIGTNTTGIGFYGTTPIAKPTVSGSRGGNAALASLLTQLAALGLITDSTTA